MSKAIDFEHLDLYVCGDTALLEEILTIFVEQAELWASRLDPALPDEDWRNAAHALKGASRGVGAWEVGDYCECAEALVAGAENMIARRRTLLADLRRALGEAVECADRVRKAA